MMAWDDVFVNKTTPTPKKSSKKTERWDDIFIEKNKVIEKPPQRKKPKYKPSKEGREAEKFLKLPWYKQIFTKRAFKEAPTTAKKAGIGIAKLATEGTRKTGETIGQIAGSKFYLKKQEQARKEKEAQQMRLITKIKQAKKPKQKQKLQQILKTTRKSEFDITRDLPTLKKTTRQVLAEAALMGTEALGVGSLASLATKGATKVAAKQGLEQIVRQGAKTGFKYGVPYGALQDLAQEKKPTAKSVAIGAGIGGAAGGIFGAGTGAFGYGAGKLGQRLINKLRTGQALTNAEINILKKPLPKTKKVVTDIFKGKEPQVGSPELFNRPVAGKPTVADMIGITKVKKPLPKATQGGGKVGGVAKDEVILYHRTSPENAAEIMRTGKFASKENTGEMFLSNKKAGQNVGYGETVVPVKVKKSDLRLDDEFPNGEKHYAIDTKKAIPVSAPKVEGGDLSKFTTQELKDKFMSLGRNGSPEEVKTLVGEIVARETPVKFGGKQVEGGANKAVQTGRKLVPQVEKATTKEIPLKPPIETQIKEGIVKPSSLENRGMAPKSKLLLSVPQKPQRVGVKDYSLAPSLTSQNDSVNKIISALKEAKPIRGKQEALYSAERGKRVGKIVGIGKQISAGKISAQQGYYQKLGALKGELPKVEFEGIANKISPDDIQSLFKQVEDSNYITPFEKLTAQGGLSKLIGAEGGQVPTEGEISLLSEVFPKELVQAILDKRPWQTRALDEVISGLNVPRTMMTTIDLSAALRQGAPLVGRKQWYPAFKDMFRYAFSEKAYQGLMQDIKNSPRYLKMREAKVAFTDMGSILSKREEAFMSKFVEKIPVFGHLTRGSNRAYSGFLNKLRFDMANFLIKEGERNGAIKDTNFLTSVGQFVNAGTGRGDLGRLNKASSVLNGIFFSPRLMASRLNLINPQFYIKLSPGVRKEAIKSMLSFGAVALTTLGLAKLAGANVETDPRNADFGKIKVGNTRYDIGAGFNQYIVLASRLISGKMISSTTGREMSLTEGYKPTTRKDILINFFQSKENPILSFVTQWLEGTTSLGQQFKPSSEVIDRFIPMGVQDINDLMQDDKSFFKSLGMALPGTFGVGVQTYGKQIPVRGKTPTGRPNIKWRNTPGLGEVITNKITKKKISNISTEYQQILRRQRELKLQKQIRKEQLRKRLGQ